jgi:hypothetical protein
VRLSRNVKQRQDSGRASARPSFFLEIEMKTIISTSYTDPNTGETITVEGNHSEATLRTELAKRQRTKSLTALNADPNAQKLFSALYR